MVFNVVRTAPHELPPAVESQLELLTLGAEDTMYDDLQFARLYSHGTCVYLQDDLDIVLSWALMTPHRYGTKVGFFTRARQRRKGFARYVLVRLLRDREPGRVFAKRNDSKSDRLFESLGFARRKVLYVLPC